MTPIKAAVPITETQMLNGIVDQARWLGYLVHHDRPAQSSGGRWATHITGQVGFPDLLLAHPRTGTVLIRELKAAGGRLTAAQRLWLDALGAAANPGHGIDVGVWRPTDWRDGTIDKELHRGAGRHR